MLMNVCTGDYIMGKKKEKENVAMKGNKPVSQKAQLEQIRKKNIAILIIGIILMVIMLGASIMNGDRTESEINSLYPAPLTSTVKSHLASTSTPTAAKAFGSANAETANTAARMSAPPVLILFFIILSSSLRIFMC